eukprot:SAG31_NODE_23866_length_494_cov_0.622785_1_plen_59_part_01
MPIRRAQICVDVPPAWKRHSEANLGTMPAGLRARNGKESWCAVDFCKVKQRPSLQSVPH